MASVTRVRRRFRYEGDPAEVVLSLSIEEARSVLKRLDTAEFVAEEVREARDTLRYAVEDLEPIDAPVGPAMPRTTRQRRRGDGT